MYKLILSQWEGVVQEIAASQQGRKDGKEEACKYTRKT